MDGHSAEVSFISSEHCTLAPARLIIPRSTCVGMYKSVFTCRHVDNESFMCLN